MCLMVLWKRKGKEPSGNSLVLGREERSEYRWMIRVKERKGNLKYISKCICELIA